MNSLRRNLGGLRCAKLSFVGAVGLSCLISACGQPDEVAWPTLDLVESMALVLPGGGLRPFLMQRYEVTVGEFEDWLHRVSYPRRVDVTLLAERDGSKPLDLRDRRDHPVVWVLREEARDYLASIGLRLPASQEWSAAAASHVLSTPDPGSGAEAVPLYTANSAETHVGGTVPVGFFEGDRTRDGIYDLAGNVSEWTEGVMLGQEGPYLMAEPESFLQICLDFAALAGLPQRDEIAADLDERARQVRYVRVHGQSWNDALMPRGAALPLVRTERLLHHRDAESVVGFRGVCDALDMLQRLGTEAGYDVARGVRLKAWIRSLPPGADGLFRRLLREREAVLHPNFVRILREHLSA